jgi:hypothetical protein
MTYLQKKIKSLEAVKSILMNILDSSKLVAKLKI